LSLTTQTFNSETSLRFFFFGIFRGSKKFECESFFFSQLQRYSITNFNLGGVWYFLSHNG